MGNAATTRPAEGKHLRPIERSLEAALGGVKDDLEKMTKGKNKCCGGSGKHGCCPKLGECCGKLKAGCLKALYVAIAVLIVLIAIALIASSTIAATATRIFAYEMSGRIVALIVLAVTAGVALSAVIASSVAALRNKVKPVQAVSAVLVILTLIQALIAGLSVKVSVEDEIILTRSLIESFNEAKEGNHKQQKLWAVTQHDLTCCGVYSAEDYRRPGVPYFPPDIHISCCPSYNPNVPDYAQENARENCKARQSFYQIGCKSPVLDVFNGSSNWVLTLVIILIVLEIVEAVLGAVINRGKKKEHPKHEEEGSHSKHDKHEKPKNENSSKHEKPKHGK